MNRNRTYLLCRWLLCLGVLCLSVLSVQANDQQEAIKLKQALSVESDPVAIMDILSRLALIYKTQPEQTGYLEQKYKLAMEIDSVPAAYSALEDLTVYYYNLSDKRDSILYWGKKVDSIASARNEYPNALFWVRSLSGRDLLTRGNYEVAMNEILDLYQLASEKEQTFGLICCTECLGLIYQAVGRDSDAVAIYQEGLDLLEHYPASGDLLHDISEKESDRVQLRMLAAQLESACSSNQLQEAEAIVAKYKKLIEKKEQTIHTEEDGRAIRREYWRLYGLCLEMYTRSGQMDKAADVLEKLDEYAGGTFYELDYVIRIDLFSRAYYYYKSGNYTQALHYINKSLDKVRLPRELSLKADILRDQGRQEEVLALYDEIYRFDERNNDATFTRQINQLRTLHELNNREMRERELEHSSRLMNQKQKQLILSSLIAGVLVFFLYVLYLYVRRAQRLRDELQHEKDSLQHSEQKLIKEMKRAQEASRMKSTFVANMSHEIRTPLNAIVGFSDLLLDQSTAPDERVEYASIIKNNTHLLLNLVDDVLDLSSMETGDLHFDLRHYPLFVCCRKALDSVRPRVREGVKLTFTPSEEPIVVYTDILRLQQLLTNLLTNSIKFTSEGEINLSYVLDEDRKQVHLCVTDTGYGIPLEKQATIFQRFEKLDEYKPGTGLGLSICRIIAERLGGTIFVDSTYTTGARFVFTHPCEVDAAFCRQLTDESK